MGVDLIGMNPQDPAGEYFRRNVWGWRPIAAYVETMCQSVIPDGCSVQDWHRGLCLAGARGCAFSPI